MCTRYTFIPENIRRQPIPSDICFPENLAPRYNIAPQQFAHVTRWVHGEPECHELQWGFAPGWLDPSLAQTNLRVETLFGTLMFDESARQRRCIVLASGWYEWPDEGRGEHPRYYFRSEGGLIGIAGIWTRSYPAKVATFAIVTTAVNPTSTFIHNRTPVILAPEVYGLWLSPAVHGQAELGRALRFYEPPDLAYHRVGAYINDAGFDSRKCIEPLSDTVLVTATGRSQSAR